MKIMVKNLGVLRQAEFSLGDLTIICGKNNTGKTYATYALYGFLAGWRENTRSVETTRITDQKVGDLLNSGITRIDLLEYVRNTDKIIGEMCESYSEFLPKIFATSKERLQDGSFRIYLDEDRISESAKSLSFQREYRAQKHRVVSMSKKKESMTLEASLLVDKLDAEIPEFLVGRLISEAINEILFARFLPDTFISSAERTGAAIFRKELNFARNRLLKEMSRADDNIDPRELLFKSYQDYALPVEKNVEFTRQIEDHVKHKSFLAEEHPSVLERFAEIIGGAYKVNRDRGLYFTPRGARVKLNMGESASGVRSMLDIGFYLHHVAERGDILMVDEPELNLHPENQRRMARLFACLTNLGIKVFITTHSDYIIKELSTLVMLNHDEPHLKRIAEREGYESSELISAEKVKVYVAEKGLVLLEGNRRKTHCHTLTEADVDPKMGIEVRAFDETIDKMNEIQQDILWGGGG